MRGDIFEPCAMADWERTLLEDDWEPDVRCPLAVLVGELGRLAEASPETIARTCLCVTDWALEHGHVATALAFAEAAALAWPQHPRYSWMAGRLLRRHGRLREAEHWIRRATKTAATAGDPEARALALNSLGNVLHDQGRNPQSLQTLRDALRIAKRHRLRSQEGEILHDLFVVATWGGEIEHADEYAQAAFEIYREGHPRLPALAHDVASLWILRGYFSRALAVLKDLPQFFSAQEEQIKVWGALARAAAACDERSIFRRAAKEVRTLAEEPEVRMRAASALLETAIGASTLKAWDLAEQTVADALEIATSTGAADIRLRAEGVLTAISTRSTDEKARRAGDLRIAPQTDALVAGFLSSLSEARIRVAV